MAVSLADKKEDVIIGSIRKETIRRNRYQERGIAFAFDEIKYQPDESLDAFKQFDKFYDAVHRYMKRKLSKMSDAEKVTFAESLSGSYFTLKGTLVDEQTSYPIGETSRQAFESVSDKIREALPDPLPTEEAEAIFQNLHNEFAFTSLQQEIAKKEYMSDNDFRKTFKPVHLDILFASGRHQLGYAFLEKTVSKKRHDVFIRAEERVLTGKRLFNQLSKYQLHQSDYPVYDFSRCFSMDWLFDFSKKLTDLFVMQSLYEFAVKHEKLVKYLVVKQCVDIGEENDFPVSIPMDPSFQQDFLRILKTVFRYKGKTLENRFASAYEQLFYLNPKMDVNTSGVINVLFPEFLAQTKTTKRLADEEAKDISDYARSFQTKKNINKSTQVLMENNQFLDSFHFVELDNEVDEKKFRLAESSFLELKETIYFPPAKDHTLRFRKLGQHQAAGLYYRYFKNLVIDLDGIQSFGHEGAHFIDFSNAEDGLPLSEQMEFRSVYELFTKASNERVEALDEHNEFKVRWNSSSKYNKEYYTSHAEIFARSFELYLYHKGIRNSLIKNHFADTPVYPVKNESLIAEITAYFDQLLPTLQKKKAAQ